jgi:hypothetical protein
MLNSPLYKSHLLVQISSLALTAPYRGTPSSSRTPPRVAIAPLDRSTTLDIGQHKISVCPVSIHIQVHVGVVGILPVLRSAIRCMLAVLLPRPS